MIEGGEATGAAPRPGPERGLAGDSARIAVSSMLSRLSGFLRIVFAAAFFGSTVLGDLFIAVNVLPLTLYDVFAGSAISSVLVPPLVRFLDRGLIARARRFAANALGLICVAMLVITELAILGRSWIAAALTSGVDAVLADEATRVAALLVLLIVPQLVLYAAIGVFVSIQHAHRRFLLPSAAPIVENVGLIITIAVAWFRYGGGREVTDAPLGLILLLGIGSGLSVAAHATLQFFGARRAGGRIGFDIDRRDPAIRRLRRPAQSSFGWSSVIALRQFALVVAAGFAGAGAVQAFEIATLAYFIPIALIGRPIASAALPRLARPGASRSEVLTGYLTTLRLAAWVAVPAGVALLVLSAPVAAALARGRFDNPEAVTMLAFGLAGLGIGAASDALFEVARQATMARGGGPGLTWSTWFRAAVAIVGIPAVVMTFDGAVVLLGLGLVVSIGDLGAFAIAHGFLRADPAWPRDRQNVWPRILVASGLAVTPALLASPGLAVIGDIPALATLVVLVLALYAAAVFLVTDRGRMIRSLATMLARKELA